MIKVLHYIPGFLYGGIESMYLSWYESIDKDSFDFNLLMRTQDDTSKPLAEYRDMGGVYYRLSSLSLRNINKFRKSVKNFFCEHNDYDIVHMHGMDFFIAYYAKMYGIKHIILHSHASEDYKGLKAFIKNNIDNIWNKYITDIFACSELAAERLTKKKIFRHKKATIVRNAIDCSKYAYNQDIRNKKRAELGINSEYVYGHVGRLTEQKNQFFLIDIFKSIVEIEPCAKLIIVGDGYLEAELKQYAKENNLEDSIIFLGNRNDVAELLQAMDCFLLPSLYEGLPVTIIEAQAAGLPCVISNQVTDEVMITDLVNKVSLDKSAKYWAENAMCHMKATTIRKDRTQEIYLSGFDINSAIKDLEIQYRNIVSGKE